MKILGRSALILSLILLSGCNQRPYSTVEECVVHVVTNVSDTRLTAMGVKACESVFNKEYEVRFPD